MGVLIFFVVWLVLLAYALSQLFARANAAVGHEGQFPPERAYVPWSAAAQWCRLVGRAPRYAWWLLFPIVNVFVYAGLAVDTARSFGKTGFGEAALAVAFAPVYFVLLARDASTRYVGPVLVAERAYRDQLAEAQRRGEKRRVDKLVAESPYRKSVVREWAEAAVFAVAAAWLIRLFVFEMFVIPTSSMEGSMLVGDYLLVSKAHYGIRTPRTIAMVPLLHNTLPFGLGESYAEWPALEMHRLPALEAIDRNDPIVFNYPLGDSVYVLPGRTWSAQDLRYGLISNPQHLSAIRRGQAPLITRPVDKKDHYVKRAVAVAGDTLEIRDREVYIDGERAVDPPNIQFTYAVTKPAGVRLDYARLEEWGVTPEDLQARDPRGAQQQIAQERFVAKLTPDQVGELRAAGATVEPIVAAKGQRPPSNQLFPNDAEHFGDWTIDNFGPVYVPEAGATVAIGPNNVALYRRVIGVYEGHDLAVRDGTVYIDGAPAREYTFAQDYYWAMGDNRHGSEDSRFWGFVPADHIVGKPLFIWWSTKRGDFGNGVNWDRLFSGATQME